MKPRIFAVRIALLAAFVGLIGATSAFARGPGELPPFSKVKEVVERYFSNVPGYQAGDLVSRSQVTAALAQVENLGWQIRDEQLIVAATLEDSNFLVEQMRTPSGRQLMRSVAADPLAFGQLDELSRLPGGNLLIRDFLRFQNSDLTFKQGARVTPADFARLTPSNLRRGAPRPEQFEKPTGRIYTVDQLLARLAISYQEEIAARSAAKSRR